MSNPNILLFPFLINLHNILILTRKCQLPTNHTHLIHLIQVDPEIVRILRVQEPSILRQCESKFFIEIKRF